MGILTEQEKELAIQQVIEQVNKKYGKGALVRGADARGLDIKRLKTGSIALDVATGGGWARGKLNEIFGQYSGGKSYVSMLTMAQTQRDYPDANIALIDFEGAFDAVWAKKIGVDVDKLIISSPEYMEDGLQIAIDLIQSKDCALIVVDSLAAACPKAEYDGEITDFTVGLRARLGNKFVRKSKGKVDLTTDELDLGQTTVLVVNQTYKNIGCFNYSAKVKLADGSTMPIGKIVTQRLPVEVQSFNKRTGKIETKKVVNWFNNGRAEKFIGLWFDKKTKSGAKAYIPCTPNHRILTPGGYKEAQDFKPGDLAAQVVDKWVPSKIQHEILIGSLLGDGAIRVDNRKRGYYTFRESHSKQQTEYLKWKASFFDGSLGESKRCCYFDSSTNDTYKEYREWFYKDKNKKHSVPDIELTPLMVSIWYQDDGYFNTQSKTAKLCTQCFDEDALDILIERLLALGIVATKQKAKRSVSGRQMYELNISKNSSDTFFNLISPYIHPELEYKVPSEYKCGGSIKNIVVDKGAIIPSIVFMPLLKTDNYIDYRGNRNKFDIEIEDNHNYLVSDVVVHNSYGDPDVTPGGEQVKFGAMIRVKIRKGEVINDTKDGTQIMQESRFSVVKNKTYPPHKAGAFWFSTTDNPKGKAGEIYRAGEIITYGVLTGVINRSGAWYSLPEEFGLEGKLQGESAVATWVEENPDKFPRLEELVMNAILKGDINE